MTNLTKKQKGTVWTLIRKEAVSLGYGTRYTENNRSEWPRKLRELRTIARKIRS